MSIAGISWQGKKMDEGIGTILSIYPWSPTANNQHLIAMEHTIPHRKGVITLLISFITVIVYQETLIGNNRA